MDGLPPTARLLGIGFYVAVSIVLGTLGGRELDKVLDTDKVFTVAGLALGLFFALWGGFRQLMDVLDAIGGPRSKGGPE